MKKSIGHVRAVQGLVVMTGLALGAGCGTSSESSFDDAGAGANGRSTDEGGTSNGTGFGPGAADAASDAGGLVLPANLVKTELGGYALGDPITGDGSLTQGVPGARQGAGTQACSLLVGVVRDFRGVKDPQGHPDFESFLGDGKTTGLVAPGLGPDRKPVYASKCEASLVGGAAACPVGPITTNKTAFDQWYRYAPGVNKPYVVYLQFAPNAGVFTFQSNFYFPLDGAGWADLGPGQDGKQHNFAFTTEIHTEFEYKGGETFTFTGDDDVWVYMNGKLAVDLGGLHQPLDGTIDVDQMAATLGLVKGQRYPFELFQAERHTSGSRFRVDTNLTFTNCGVIPPDAPK